MFIVYPRFYSLHDYEILKKKLSYEEEHFKNVILFSFWVNKSFIELFIIHMYHKKIIVMYNMKNKKVFLFSYCLSLTCSLI